MQLWIASANSGKINEFKTILSSLPIEFKSTLDLKVYSSPRETGKTFEENARIKAKSVRSIQNKSWVVADDSGLEVEGLNNMPGIHSARYAGDRASDGENNAKLLKMMSLRSAQNRKARFVCCLVVISPEGEEIVLHGELTGEISKAAKGTTGFGYDPIFIPTGETLTLAELGLAAKNKISHRAQALRLLADLLKQRL